MEILSRMLGAGSVLALLAGLLWFLRRRGFAGLALPGASGRLIEVLESRALGAHLVLHVVRVADRALVLAAHPAGCSLVESRPVAEIRPGGKEAIRAGTGFLMILFLLLLLPATPLGAAPPPPQGRLFGVSFGETGSAASVSVPMQVALLMTLLSLLPAVVMSVTPFLRITIVLHFLRQAMGTQSTPSNQVLVGLSLFLTMLIVAPVASEIRDKAWTPLEKGAITESQALEEASRPVKTFLARYAREKDVRLFVELAHAPAPRSAADLDLGILVPAYILSELNTGFQIGAVLFLPFLVIDVVVASVTLAIGMVQLPPVMISAPFKILLFVLVDGWNLTVGSLIKSFY